VLLQALLWRVAQATSALREEFSILMGVKSSAECGGGCRLTKIFSKICINVQSRAVVTGHVEKADR
jgi:hypothetical protein